MALVKFGGGITDMRGSIGGNVYTRNRFGAVCRQNTKPVNPKTSRQDLARSIMALVVSSWNSTASAAQKLAWETYADSISWLNKLGESVNLTGFNHFVRSNCARRQVNYSMVYAGPTTLTLPSEDNDFAVSPSSASQHIAVSFNDGLDWVSENSAVMHISMGLPKNAGVNYFEGPWQRIGELKGNSGSPLTSPQNVNVSYPIAEDQKIFCKATIQRADGRLSKPFRDNAVVSG